MLRTSYLWLLAGGLCCWTGDVQGQVTLQQPVVSRFATGNTVVVPDRGSTLLGGVSSGASGRTTLGPWRGGTASGQAYQGSSLRVGVFIHDLQGMDEALLATGIAAENEESAAALRLSARYPDRQPEVVPRGVAVPDRGAQAERFELLARQALERGKPAVAKLHWQMAARYGSSMAAAQLAQLD